MTKAVIFLAAALVVGGCGGRVAKPVLTNSTLDARLSCEHFQGEYENNTKRLAELQGEKKQSSANNAGFLVASPLFLDTQGTFKKESEAILLRNERLKTLMAERGCDAPAAAPSPAQ
jgi:hypothetical protein